MATITLNIEGIVVSIQFYMQNEVSDNTSKDRDDGAPEVPRPSRPGMPRRVSSLYRYRK